MAIKEVLDLAKEILTERRMQSSLPLVEGLREHEVLPDSVLKRRSFEVDDDLATALVLADGMELTELRRRVRPGAEKLLSHPPHLVEAWATCETLRRLGFRTELTAVSWGPVPGQGDDIVHVVVGDGRISIVLCVARFPAKSHEEALGGWDDLWKDVSVAGEDDLAILLARTNVGQYPRLVALVAELCRQGMGIPAAPGLRGPLTLVENPLANLTQGGGVA